MIQQDIEQARRILLTILFYVAIAVLLIVILSIYSEIQVDMFSGANTILFVDSHNDLLEKAIIFGGIPLVLYVMYERFCAFSGHIPWFKLIPFSICVAIFVFMGFSYSLFHYSYLDKQGIHIRENLFENVKEYKYSDVKKVQVISHTGDTRITRRHFYIDYLIELKDGIVIDLENSYEFWKKIERTDDFLVAQNIDIERMPINQSVYIQLLITYFDSFSYLNYNSSESTSGDIIEKIFNYEFTY